jgi:hypothetical protein
MCFIRLESHHCPAQNEPIRLCRGDAVFTEVVTGFFNITLDIIYAVDG